MANFGARKDMKPGSFDPFDGSEVVAGSFVFQGSRPAEVELQIGDTVMLLVQAEVRAVTHSPNADQDLVRRHTLRVVEATLPPQDINDQVVDAIRDATDKREGKTPLPFDGEDDEPTDDEPTDD